jgi:hypothetical protein
VQNVARMARALWPYALIVALGLLGVFALPWYVPVTGPPNISDSYIAGFNNHVAQTALIVMAAALAILAWRQRRPTGSHTRVWLTEVPADERVDRRAVAVVYGAAAVSALVWCWSALQTFQYGEKGYFLDRMAYVAAGYVPYRDFEFPYGPLLIYIPAWTRQLLRHVGVSPSGSYLIVYAALFMLGFVILRWAVDRLRIPRDWKVLLFLGIASLAVINEGLGLGFTLFRFATPVASVLFVHVRATSMLQSEKSHPWLRVAGLSLCAVLLNLAISPEMGVAVYIALGAYLITSIAEKRGEPLASIALYVAAPLSLLLLRINWFTSIVEFGRGGNDLLILPGPPMLIYFATVVIVAVFLPRLLAAPRPDAAATTAVGALALVLAPAALGRADVAHLTWNSIALMMLAAAATARVSKVAFRTYLAATVAVYLTAHAIGFSVSYQHLPHTEQFAALPLSAQDARTLDSMPGVAAPYGFLDDVVFHLADKGNLLSSNFMRIPIDLAGVQKWETFLDHVPYALVPSNEFPETPDPSNDTPWQEWGAGWGDWGLAMFPMDFAAKNEPPNPPLLMDTYLRKNYERMGNLRGYVILRRTTPLAGSAGTSTPTPNVPAASGSATGSP